MDPSGIDSIETRVRKLEKSLMAFSGELRLALSYMQPDAAASSLTKSRIVLEKLLARHLRSRDVAAAAEAACSGTCSPTINSPEKSNGEF